QALAAALEGGRDAPLRAALDLRARARRRAAAAAEPARPTLEGDDDGAIHIANAGLVLTSAFLPHLFRTLDFIAIEPSGRQGWKSPELRDRAVHLLQWLVDERCDAPEPQLALNKLLCGMHPSEPVVAEIIPTKEERDALGQLLAAILANWPPLQSSSAAALRETYLQRDGRLAPGDNGWTLEVERKVLDILIDQLPWGFSTILHPWMAEVVNVSWG
ncbi:MAG TPA: contractile injection system tape measure protein, partial [Allosphingosinicella sp.]